MTVSTDKATTTKKRVSKKTTQKPSMAILATCPTSGAGWCAYPFSPKQLEKRMRTKAQLSELDKISQKAKKKTK
jgi:hypothetical protein